MRQGCQARLKVAPSILNLCESEGSFVIIFIHLFNSGHDDKTISGVYFSFNTFSPFLFKLEASFNSNVATIEANCERVEARINTLLEKFETKGR